MLEFFIDNFFITLTICFLKYQKSFRCFQASLWDNIELLQDLLQGDDCKLINTKDSWGRTPIHAAAITANSQCLKLLIAHGANVNVQVGPRADNKTALHMSAEYGHKENIENLIDAGASLDIKDANGLTPYDLSERAGHRECMEVLKHATG